MTAAPFSRPAVSVRVDGDRLVFACGRCDGFSFSLAVGDESGGLYEEALRGIAEHEESHAPTAGDGIRVYKNVLVADDESVLIPHDLPGVASVWVVDRAGHQHPMPHWTDMDGSVEVVGCPAEPGFTTVEVWLIAKT